MEVEEYSWAAENTRHGFNGMEKDDDMYGRSGSSYDFGARMYNHAIGRWLARDPWESVYPGITPYNYAANTPILFGDEGGKHWKYNITRGPDGGGEILISTTIHLYGPQANTVLAENVAKDYATMGTSGVYIDSNGNEWKITVDVDFVYRKVLSTEFNKMNDKYLANINSDNPKSVMDIPNPNGATGPDINSFSQASQGTLNPEDNILLVNDNAEGMDGGLGSTSRGSAQVRYNPTGMYYNYIHETLHAMGYHHFNGDVNGLDVNDVMREFMQGSDVGLRRTFSYNYIIDIGYAFENGDFIVGNAMTMMLGESLIKNFSDVGVLRNKDFGYAWWLGPEIREAHEKRCEVKRTAKANESKKSRDFISNVDPIIDKPAQVLILK